MILVLHGFVLLIFFANACGTLFEVVARYCGAGADANHGAQRGGLMAYGWRQLRNRQPDQQRRRDSMTSDAALALDTDAKSAHMLGGTGDRRSRSQSTSSQMMLNGKRASGFDPISQRMSHGEYPETPGGSRSPRRSINGPDGRRSESHSGRPSLGLSPVDTADPYFRAPRGRRNTLDPYTPAVRSRLSGGLDNWGGAASPTSPPGEGGQSQPDQGLHREGSNTDYAVREVDLFYGQRGPALSDNPSRKRKTGPADPMGKVSSAATLFNRLIGGVGKGKTKEEGKGFEVVRSARPPPPMKDLLAQGHEAMAAGEEQEMQMTPSMRVSPSKYEQVPNEDTAIFKADRQEDRIGIGHTVSAGAMPFDGSYEDEDSDAMTDDERPTIGGATRAESPPMLLPIDTTGLDVSFLQRQISTRPGIERLSVQGTGGPAIPRKSSRRMSSVDHTGANPIVAPPPSGSNISLGRRSSIPVAIGLDADNERPTSLGVVSQRTTRDSIVHGGGVPDTKGSAAEIVDKT